MCRIPGDKAVVVSQWTSVLRLVESELQNARVRSVTLSGSVPVPARPPLINALNDPNSDVKVITNFLHDFIPKKMTSSTRICLISCQFGCVYPTQPNSE